jgi:hypothetical protein
MTLEELVQKLEEANPWTLEKVESIFNTKFTKLTYNYAKDSFYSYIAKSLHFEEGLIVEEVELRVDGTSKEMVRLIINLNDESNCFTLDRIKQTYPDIYYGSKNRLDSNFQNAKVYFLTNKEGFDGGDTRPLPAPQAGAAGSKSPRKAAPGAEKPDFAPARNARPGHGDVQRFY